MSIKIGDLQPGRVFEFAKPTELDDFQNQVALSVKPELSTTRWKSVGRLSGEIRPPNFNGNFTQIIATSLENPYDMLLDTEKRGLKHRGYSVQQRYRRETPDLDYFRETTLGFRIDSIGKSVNGVLDTMVEVFFVQLPRQRKKQPEPKKPYAETTNTYGHFYDYERGETVWCERENNFRVTLRRPVSVLVYDQEALEKIRNTGVLYSPASGTSSPGSNPTYQYND
jgi:hypothetical protein